MSANALCASTGFAHACAPATGLTHGGLQRRNPLFQRRMRHVQPLDTGTEAAGNTEGRKLTGQVTRLVRTLQGLQCTDHLAAAGQRSATRIGAKLAATRKPHDDHRCKQPQHQLGDNSRDPEAGAMTALVAQQDAIDEVRQTLNLSRNDAAVLARSVSVASVLCSSVSP